ncbi:hypothetical protein [Vallitalea guaymasensis]|nr:hypothetical protein [Vallitalea guaymasensis]
MKNILRKLEELNYLIKKESEYNIELHYENLSDIGFNSIFHGEFLKAKE